MRYMVLCHHYNISLFPEKPLKRYWVSLKESMEELRVVEVK